MRSLIAFNPWQQMREKGGQSKENASTPRKSGALHRRKAPNAESAKYRDLNSPNTHFVFQAPGIEKPVYRAVTTDIRD